MIRLEQLRLDAFLTTEALGQKAKVSPGTIRNIERGKGAQVATLAKLSTFFEVPASELLRDVADLEAAA